ncbi:hypothetical protein Y032_0223g2662 [Ancylostoma ceylanicum]|uniref:Phlebovirus glycoprotein G2 fusion domain-containing protein n=1 Tax=Ancylostoma ceylanicum TaxID=53326 RepID=A0A016SIA6_9BILA|nr:hypothetical protein Y032_0223g2662 [Ancylostoma ceylanicum]
MEWSAARVADKKEEEIYNEYINTYGDYSSTVQQAVDALDNNDELFNAIDVELGQRHLPIEAPKDDLKTDNIRRDADANAQKSAIPPINVAEISQANMLNMQTVEIMNFGDASILSRLDLPTFDGNLLEFPEFFARFTALIGSKKQLDDTTKFSLLKSCLKGRALQSIQGLALTTNNYAIALDILKSRYDDKVTIRHILFSQLANLPQCDPEGKHLQSLYNKMYSLTRQFCIYEDDSKEVALGAILLNNNSYAGMIAIRVKGLYFTCKKKTEFFTRDHHFYSESVHRCRFSGSCNTGTCDKTKPTDKLKELSNTANNHPGYTFCAASCGCLTCGGCFFCLTSCLFYRYYAYPETPTVYTVFNCPLWEFTVDAHITLQQNDHSEGTDLVLHPARTARWNNIRISLIASMVPQMPILSSTFVTDGKTIAITKPATSGQLIPNTIGQLQCATYGDAKHFRCSFPSNVCVCSPATNQAVCTCSHGNISEVFKKNTTSTSQQKHHDLSEGQ